MTELPRVDVPPPLPAPYLEGAPELSAPLSYGSPLSIPDRELDKIPRLRRDLRREVRKTARAILRRRREYEQQHGVVIKEEPPTTH